MDTLPDPEEMLDRLVERMAGSVSADARLVGIYSGGAWIAERLAARLPGAHPVGFLDVSFHRDDYASKGLHRRVRKSELPFEVDGATIVLVDDVLFTGRSVRAAINEVFDYGRPATIELAILIDRGGRELPIEANWVGGRVSVARDRKLALSRSAEGRLSLRLEPRDPESA